MRVLLATDRPSLGAALAVYLGEHDVNVVGIVAHALDIVDAAAAARAEVVVADPHLGPCLVDAVTELRQVHHTPVVLLSSGDDRLTGAKVDADAIAAFGDPPDTLLALIGQVGVTR